MQLTANLPAWRLHLQGNIMQARTSTPFKRMHLIIAAAAIDLSDVAALACLQHHLQQPTDDWLCA
jgi:hypothetical protein